MKSQPDRSDDNNAVTDEQRAGLHAQLDIVDVNCAVKRERIAARQAQLDSVQDTYLQAELEFNVALDRVGELIQSPEAVERLRSAHTQAREAASSMNEEQIHLRLQQADLEATQARLRVLREAIERLPGK